MSKHGRGADGLKRSSKSRQSNDSLRDTDANTISGGMGERKTTSEESRQGFADDELESLSFLGPMSHKSSGNRCNRCQTELSTKARYCRRCYEERGSWMPLRPTRQKRRRPRNEQHEERCSTQRHAVRSLDRGTDWDQLFNPLATVQKGPKGEGLLLPGSKFSNLPQFARRRKSSTSSISSAEFQKEKREHKNGSTALYRNNKLNDSMTPASAGSHLAKSNSVKSSSTESAYTDQYSEPREERRREWLKRRVYYRWEGEGVEQMQWGEVLPRCLVCKVRQSDTYVVHGCTAHACVCQRCAMSLLDRRGRCPQCNTLATGITKKPR